LNQFHKSQALVQDDTIAIDATHIEARDQVHPKKEDQPKPEPKMRGCKTKQEREAWLEQKQQEEAQKPIYEKEIAAQLDEFYDILRYEMPLDPQWGIKKKQQREKRILVWLQRSLSGWNAKPIYIRIIAFFRESK